MARIARVIKPGAPHHVIQRGNRRQQVFFKQSDYKEYKALMGEWCDRSGVEIWAYCLMRNHVHLICVPLEEESLAQAIGQAHVRYTRMINFREKWRGYLWQGRFSSYPMDESYLYTAVRYIELNPVKAGLVKNAWDYPWSSAKAHIKGKVDELIRMPGIIDTGKWKSFLKEGISEEEAEKIRRNEISCRPMGKAGFIEELERETGRILRKQKRGPKGPRKKRR